MIYIGLSDYLRNIDKLLFYLTNSSGDLTNDSKVDETDANMDFCLGMFGSATESSAQTHALFSTKTSLRLLLLRDIIYPGEN